MKTVLYISYDGMTDPLGQSQVLPYLKGLSKNGYSISLISCEKAERFEKHRETIEQMCQASNIDWHPLKYTKKPPLFSTLWDVRKINKKAKAIYQEKQFELVYCRSYIAALSAMHLKKNYGTKMLFDMRGFWADERIDGNIWSLSNPVFKKAYQFFKKKEKQFFSESDHIVSLTENGKQEILSWNLPSVANDKITVIPCCVDIDLFNPANLNISSIQEKRATLGLTDTDFVLGYVGSIGTWYMLSEMLDYFKTLKQQIPNTKFLFVTGENPESIFLLQLKKESNKKTSSSPLVCTKKYQCISRCFINPSFSFAQPTPKKHLLQPNKEKLWRWESHWFVAQELVIPMQLLSNTMQEV